MRRFGFLIVAVLLLLIYPVMHKHLWQNRTQVRRAAEASYVLPSQFSRILALGHQGMVSDYLFLKTLTFFGQRFQAQERYREEDWVFLINSLDVVTDLDPYFWDPYVFAEGMLTWEAKKYEEANRLLKKGQPYLRKNWRLPFFIGFNYFYFLKDYEKGAEYLMEASRIAGSPDFLKPLAARLTYYGRQAKTGILFLKGMLSETRDQRLQKILEKRLDALQKAAFIEEKIAKFKNELSRQPENIEELVEKGYIKKLPEDPYGGRWMLLKSGRVYSTSRFAEKFQGKPKTSSP